MQLPNSYAENIRKSIEMLCDRSSLLIASQVPSWCNSSILAREVALSPAANALENAKSTGQLLLTHSFDHLAAFRQLLDPKEPVCSVAIYTCARGTLETAAISKWLVDPQIGCAERIRRVFAMRVDSINEQRKAANANGDAALADKADKRIAQVLNEAQGFGVPVDAKKVIGGKPGATAIIQQCLQMEMLYRMLSALSHGQHWAIRGLSMQEVKADDTPGIARTDGKYFEPAVRMNYLAVIAKETVSATCIALHANAVFNGWNTVPFINLFEDVFAHLKLGTPRSIWQNQ
ncbi:hypothetical protein [Rhodopirellula europaea]|uniref:Uncharacterized protein n=1 Tax=Rhodopirellula europaea SH398 TaxID=1263868 RepID=M5SHK1_9BACT|nr:hypothetical protein [Rhodopirellula europaea]EMI27182.1 hypothetical protein RESH_02189 [Rhodopirellula europaea SH398]